MERRIWILEVALRGGSALEQGIAVWKYYSNLLSHLARKCWIWLHHTEYIPGYRAIFTCSVLEAVNFSMNSDGFVFDQEIIAQCRGLRSAN